MNSPDSFSARGAMSIGSESWEIWRLSALGKAGFDIASLPYGLKILLENLLRNENGTDIAADDIRALAGWNPQADPDTEIRFTPARVVLQDFTGVPAVVDLAAMRDAMRALDGLALPAGVEMEFSGENETIMTAMEDLLLMLLLGIAIVYLIMVAQFQSLLSPLIVLVTVPLAFTGGLLALLIAGSEISIVAMIGFIMLVGIIVNNGIVLIDTMNQLRLEGMERREAIENACSTRLRPVLMTALTTILGLVPLAIGSGMGAGLVQPVAIVSIGGLTYATFMTLFIVPILYDMLVKRSPRKVSKEDMEAIKESD